jgi:Superfamily I DNA and RNA helicases
MRSAWGQPSYNPASRFLTEIPEALVDWKRSGAAAVPPSRGVLGGLTGTRGIPSSTSPGVGRGTRSRGMRDREVVALTVGDRVTHDMFGLGTVVEAAGAGDRAEATIDFGAVGKKRLLLRYAPVEKL